MVIFMANEIRERFRERKYSYKNKRKKHKSWKKHLIIDRNSVFYVIKKIDLFLPITVV